MLLQFGLYRTDMCAHAVPQEDEEMWQVYGCYAAVALADARALQALRTSLPTLLADRHWQVGGVGRECAPTVRRAPPAHLLNRPSPSLPSLLLPHPTVGRVRV